MESAGGTIFNEEIREDQLLSIQRINLPGFCLFREVAASLHLMGRKGNQKRDEKNQKEIKKNQKEIKKEIKNKTKRNKKEINRTNKG